MRSGVFISEAGKITYTLLGYYHSRHREVYPIGAIRYTIYLKEWITYLMVRAYCNCGMYSKLRKNEQINDKYHKTAIL